MADPTEAVSGLIERIEAEMLTCITTALEIKPCERRTSLRTAAAEYATVLLALRAHPTPSIKGGDRG